MAEGGTGWRGGFGQGREKEDVLAQAPTCRLSCKRACDTGRHAREPLQTRPCACTNALLRLLASRRAPARETVAGDATLRSSTSKSSDTCASKWLHTRVLEPSRTACVRELRA
eukprot:2878450-Pleurochrysis_carterae.AAC.2